MTNKNMIKISRTYDITNAFARVKPSGAYHKSRLNLINSDRGINRKADRPERLSQHEPGDQLDEALGS